MDNYQQKTDFENKLIDLRRVTRVTAGGKRFNFRAAVLIGNRAGKVGLGIGKGADTAIAIEKAARKAKKNLVNVFLTEIKSVAHEVEGKFGNAHIKIRPAVKYGKGLIAGGAVRNVLALAGVKKASAKILSPSKNKINNAMAALEALKKIKIQDVKIKISNEHAIT